MLVLSRKKDETIVINDQIEIRVLEIKGDTVRIGIVAPKEIKVYRKELFDAIVQENKQAGASSNNLAALKSLPLSKNTDSE
jgi:carbon storage regulator